VSPPTTAALVTSSTAPPAALAPTAAASPAATSVAPPEPAAPAPATGPLPPAASEADASPPLKTVASERARQFAFPFTLVLLVVAFLALHGRVDRTDARLATAPVDDDRRRFR
jgi:hypothetical protein